MCINQLFHLLLSPNDIEAKIIQNYITFNHKLFQAIYCCCVIPITYYRCWSASIQTMERGYLGSYMWRHIIRKYGLMQPFCPLFGFTIYETTQKASYDHSFSQVISRASAQLHPLQPIFFSHKNTRKNFIPI